MLFTKRDRSVILRSMDKLKRQAELMVIKTIESECKRKNLTFSSVGFGYNTTNKVGEIVDNKRIEDWLEWFGENFGRIGFYYFTEGKWIAGETRLIKFSKPY
jgi:hypothetical protein